MGEKFLPVATNTKVTNASASILNPTANWVELPADLTGNILQRIGMFDILQNAQKVCTTWRKICKDPAMWRVIYMDNSSGTRSRLLCQEICKLAVDRSQGQLVDLSITHLVTHSLLQYISDRSSQLKRLEVIYNHGDLHGKWGAYLKKFPLLEELSLEKAHIEPKDIEDAGRYCPMLKTLKLNRMHEVDSGKSYDDVQLRLSEMAITIGKSLHNLRHLELVQDSISNIGLQAILDGCYRLESLDICQCPFIDLKKDDIGKTCSEQIEDLKLPGDDAAYRYYGDLSYDDFIVVDEDGYPIGDLSDMMAPFSV
ncbi:putative F-box/LRR-repeat protein 9 [Rutidosis leptorrhynchoides]|uniref:putative F-box/LRR-repeat protein 9 n=1 Tax=Rutidosis leptorrhynchoides TaxID=125765 RepID=UPI003A99252F